MYEVCEVVVIGPDTEWLTDLSQYLIDKHLMACARITEVRSISRSNGEIHDRHKARAVMHTQRSRVAAIVDHVERAHPDEPPSLTVMPIVDGNPGYMQWVPNHTKIPK